MKPFLWSRGDLCSYLGDLAIVLASTNRAGNVEIDMLVRERGHRSKPFKSPAAILRRPTKAQLLTADTRLRILVERTKVYARHVGLELKRRRRS